jgi:phospholipase A1
MPAAIDDNPDISEYIGRGDVNVIYVKMVIFSIFNGSHNLTFNSNSGNASFSWSYPVKII